MHFFGALRASKYFACCVKERANLKKALQAGEDAGP